MVLCEIHELGGSLLVTYLALSLIGLVFILGFSVAVFATYYISPSYAQWRRKLAPDYPPPEKVRSEILQTLKGLVTATICPALSLYLAQHGRSQAYCGVGPKHGGALGLALQFALIWVASDLYEFAYHYLGHTYKWAYDNHKAHHAFFNPSPFAVIADDMVDQFVRSAPLLLFPLLLPVNIDLLFFTFAVFFYGYGSVLHWGHESELELMSAHSPYINGSYHHWYHHAHSILGQPFYCGFFFRAWDRIAGSEPAAGAPCLCSRCECERGHRSPEQWAALKIPSYAPLLSPPFWLAGVAAAVGLGGKSK